MKKILFLLCLINSGLIYADSKLSVLTQDTTCQSTDLMYKVDSPAGTPTSRSVSISNLLTFEHNSTNTWTAQQSFSSGTFSTALNLSYLTNGSIPFINNGLLSQNNSKLFWDNTNFRVGIGTNSPTQQLELTGNLKLPLTTANTGIIYAGNSTFFHNFGQHNVFLGLAAGNLSLTGTNNSGFGETSLLNDTSGVYNTAVGYGALILNTTGNNNNGIGTLALEGVTTGSNNTGVGYNAGNTITVGSNNTFLGYNANASTNNLTNATAIGYNTTVNASNALVLGNNAVVGINQSNPGAQLEIDAGASSTIGQIIKSAASQSVDIAQIQNSAGSKGIVFGYNGAYTDMWLASSGRILARNATNNANAILFEAADPNMNIGGFSGGNINLTIPPSGGVFDIKGLSTNVRFQDSNNNPQQIIYLRDDSRQGLAIMQNSATQSADLLDLDTSGGSVLSCFKSTGPLILNGTTTSNSGDMLSVKSASATVEGMLHIGRTRVTNNCGAGVTTCTASCTGSAQLMGGGCNGGGVALTQDGPGNNPDTDWTCSALAVTTISAYAYCARLNN